MMANLKLSRALTLVSLISILAMTPPLLADDSRLSVQLSSDGTLLIVGDPARSAVAVYRITGTAVSLIATRELEKDMARDPSKTKASAVPVPAKDVPGQDPPDFQRPENSVRIGAAYGLQGDSEAWSAEYLVSGTLEQIYEKLRSLASQGWRVSRERITPFSSAEIHMDRDLVGMSVTLEKRTEGVVAIEVKETRTRKKP